MQVSAPEGCAPSARDVPPLYGSACGLGWIREGQSWLRQLGISVLFKDLETPMAGGGTGPGDLGLGDWLVTLGLFTPLGLSHL